MRKSIRAFIREHAEEMREIILRAVPNVGKLTYEDLREWILNDEGFYRWAQREGVNV